MAYLIFVLKTLALLIGFVALTQYETGRGVRFFAAERMRFDKNVERFQFIWEHVDLGSFVRGELHHLARRIAHDSAHLSLQTVRAVERLLTRLVRHIRTRQPVTTAPRENARAFVKTLSDFKDGLKATHPDVSEIQ